ncbi:MAG: hypothetical protein ACJAWI_001895 [Marinomonas primoryensis]|jgi:hypothetical protein
MTREHKLTPDQRLYMTTLIESGEDWSPANFMDEIGILPEITTGTNFKGYDKDSSQWPFSFGILIGFEAYTALKWEAS